MQPSGQAVATGISTPSVTAAAALPSRYSHPVPPTRPLLLPVLLADSASPYADFIGPSNSYSRTSLVPCISYQKVLLSQILELPPYFGFVSFTL